MPKYMIEASFTLDGIRGVQKEGGTGRRTAVKQAIEGIGGKLESFYFAFGTSDVYVIADLPDNVTAMALLTTIGSSGAVRTKTTVLLTPADMDKAIKKKVGYRPPGAR